MTITTKIIFIIALILSIIIPFGYYLIGEKNKKRYKRTIGVNAFFFFGAFALASIMMLGGDVQAAQGVASDSGFATGMGYIAAALVTGCLLYTSSISQHFLSLHAGTDIYYYMNKVCKCETCSVYFFIAISLLIGFPFAENFSSYSVITFPWFISSL